MLERDFFATLRALREGGVEFLVVGGLAAVLDGAPINTFDVDVVHKRLVPVHSVPAVSQRLSPP